MIFGFGFVHWPEYGKKALTLEAQRRIVKFRSYYAFRDPWMQGSFWATRRAAFVHWFADRFFYHT